MSWIYLPAEAVGALAESCLAGSRSVTSSGTEALKESCWPGLQMVVLKTPRSGTTRKASRPATAPFDATSARCVAKWASRRVSPVSHSPAPEKGLESTTPETCGLRQRESLAKYDRSSRSWKTSQLLLLPDILGPSSVTWTKSGMTRRGAYFPLPELDCRTSENASGFWPTPDVGYGGRAIPDDAVSTGRGLKRSSNGKKVQVSLENSVKLWPTPRANDAEKRGEFDVENPRNGLPAAAKLWATPRVSDGNGAGAHGEGGSDLRTQVAMFPTPRAEFDSGKHDGRPDTLHSFVKAFPTPNTPRAHECESSVGKHQPNRNQKELADVVARDGGQLNPAWVELLMGWCLHWSGEGPASEFQQWLNHEGRYSLEALRDGSWEHGVPRVAKGVKNRVSRLKALGNGQVPACMVQAWHVLNRIRSENP